MAAHISNRGHFQLVAPALQLTIRLKNSTRSEIRQAAQIMNPEFNPIVTKHQITLIQ